MKLLEEESDNPEFSSEDVNVNSISIEEISDPVPQVGRERELPN